MAKGRVNTLREMSRERRFLFKKTTKNGRAGLVDWLATCPEKDWFRPLESELTDTLATHKP